MLVLCLKKLGSLTWLFLHQKGEKGVGIYNPARFSDWELEGVCSYFELLYSYMPRGEGDDRLSWKLTRIGVFDVHSYYFFLISNVHSYYIWLSGTLTYTFPLEEHLVCKGA